MAIPEWADEGLSSELPILRARGESQYMEYIASFPEQARDLGKEIAAFATSNAGTILLGVSDDGGLLGIQEAESTSNRDALLRRLEGICTGTVRPAVTPIARFALEKGRTVLMIAVPEGTQPVYYCQQVPYVRHITSSRPAEPQEVVDLIRAWLETRQPSLPATKYEEFLAELGPVLGEFLALSESFEERLANPWLSELQATFQADAIKLRELAARDIAAERGLVESLAALAKVSESVAHHRLHMGPQSLSELNERIRQVQEQTVGMIERVLDDDSRQDNWGRAAREHLRVCERQLEQLVARLDDLVEAGRITDAQREAANIGVSILSLSYFGLNRLGQSSLERLRVIGRDLRQVETERVMLDGGQSLRRIADRISSSAAALRVVMKQIPL